MISTKKPAEMKNGRDEADLRPVVPLWHRRKYEHRAAFSASIRHKRDQSTLRLEIGRRDLVVFFAATISSQTTSFDTKSVRRAAGRGHCKNSNELCVAATRPSEARAKLYASEWRTWGGDVTRCSPLCVQGRTLPNNNKSRLHCPRRQRRADIFFRRPPSALEIPKSTPPRCYIDGDETIARLVECVCTRARRTFARVMLDPLLTQVLINSRALQFKSGHLRLESRRRPLSRSDICIFLRAALEHRAHCSGFIKLFDMREPMKKSSPLMVAVALIEMALFRCYLVSLRGQLGTGRKSQMAFN